MLINSDPTLNESCNISIVEFTSSKREEWDHYLSSIEESTYMHSWNWLDYMSKHSNVAKNASFILIENKKNILAVCSLGISKSENDFHEVSFSGAPIGTPALARLSPSKRRQTMVLVYELMLKRISDYKINKIKMTSNPLNLGFCNHSLDGGRGMFEPQSFQFLPDVSNTIVLDLSLTEKELSDDLSQVRRRYIRKGVQKGLRVQTFDSKSDPEAAKNNFNLFKQAHYESAGKWTRPMETWDSMLETLLCGNAALFVCYLADTPISFLFCGSFFNMAFGWSQVNVDRFEHEYSPRHLLEWEAILYYQKNGFKYYEVGDRCMSAQWFSNPTPKQILISEFKERYGGFLMPKIQWVGYCDLGYAQKELSGNIDSLIKNLKPVSHPSFCPTNV